MRVPLSRFELARGRSHVHPQSLKASSGVLKKQTPAKKTIRTRLASGGVHQRGPLGPSGKRKRLVDALGALEQSLTKTGGNEWKDEEDQGPSENVPVQAKNPRRRRNQKKRDFREEGSFRQWTRNPTGLERSHLKREKRHLGKEEDGSP